MSENGRLPLSSLVPIGNDAYLETNAAAAWKQARVAIETELGVPPLVVKVGAYRNYAEQVEQKRLAIRDGVPNRAATPGTSTHGTGISVDINNISRYPLARLEAVMLRYGFRRNVPYESWHFTHNGSTTAGGIGTEITEKKMPLDDNDKAWLNSLGSAIIDQVDRRVKPNLDANQTQLRADLGNLLNDSPYSLRALNIKVQSIIDNPTPTTGTPTDVSELVRLISALPAATVLALKNAL